MQGKETFCQCVCRSQFPWAMGWRKKMSKHKVFYKYFTLVFGLLDSEFQKIISRAFCIITQLGFIPYAPEYISRVWSLSNKVLEIFVVWNSGFLIPEKNILKRLYAEKLIFSPAHRSRELCGVNCNWCEEQEKEKDLSANFPFYNTYILSWQHYIR